MEDFHRAQRRRFDVLLDVDAPVGGRWNLHADNREPPLRPPWTGFTIRAAARGAGTVPAR